MTRSSTPISCEECSKGQDQGEAELGEGMAGSSQGEEKKGCLEQGQKEEGKEDRRKGRTELMEEECVWRSTSSRWSWG